MKNNLSPNHIYQSLISIHPKIITVNETRIIKWGPKLILPTGMIK